MRTHYRNLFANVGSALEINGDVRGTVELATEIM